MSTYKEDSAFVDSSAWQRPVSNKDGEQHPAPAPMQRDKETGLMKRTPTSDPYANGGNGHTVRNFGHTA